ncbi:MAG: IS4 family transposase [Lachnospiraceae bacterium]|nr:IS4 family transposase [Oribacterium sp.]MDY6361124.1 IS4 family transposase [Lachnospiraceae bacterium]
MSYAQQVKESISNIITEMAKHAGDYSLHPDKDFSRSRKLSFPVLLHLMLSMETGSIRDELLKYFDFDVNTASVSAFIQQRNKLSLEAFSHILYQFNDLYPHSLYKGKYLILAADGSSFTFTRNSNDPDSYFAADGKTTNGYNQVHVIPLYDVISKRYTDCIVQPIRKKNEFQAFCDLIDRCRVPKNVTPIFIADRGFHSLNVFAHAIEKDACFLVRATDVKMKNLLGSDYPEDNPEFDINITRILTRSSSAKKHMHPERSGEYKVICKAVPFDYIIPGKQDEYEISLRVLRFKISDDGYENVITNLPVGQFSSVEIKKIYHLRWGIETSFRELKYAIGASNFHAKSRRLIEMEVWARLILYNFCSIVTGHVVIEKKCRKHTYQVNYTSAYKICHYVLALHNGESPPETESLIGKWILPIRPDRKYARQHRFQVPVSFTYRFG